MSQRQKFAVFLTILVVVPVFAVGLLGLYAINNDLKTYRLEDQQSAQRSLAALSGEIKAMLLTEGASIRTEAETLHKRGLWGLRCIFQIACQPYDEKRIDMIISFDENGNQLYPPPDSSAQLYSESQALKQVATALAATRTQLESLPPAAQAAGVWSSYQTQDGHQLLLCWQGTAPATLCVSLDREWLITKTGAILAGALARMPAAPQNNKMSIRLVDLAGSTLWPADTGTPDQQDAKSTPDSETAAASSDLTTRPLEAPLYFWRLEMARTAPAFNTFPLTMLALIIPVTALLALVARALFQGQRAALAEAEERAGFAASISHELRTPLTNLQLYADLILAKAPKIPPPEGEAITNYTKVIASESTRLSELVNNALTIARNPEGEARQKTAAIPDHIILETINRLAPLLEGHSGRISQNLNAGTKVMIDRPALEQILVNLLDNARKYAAGARIRISSRQQGNRFILTVRDWGTAFSPPDHKTLFSPFSRGKKSRHNKGQPEANPLQEGFGLGLAVCNQLCLANNGTIRAEEAGPGARFIAILETAPAPPQTGKI